MNWKDLINHLTRFLRLSLASDAPHWTGLLPESAETGCFSWTYALAKIDKLSDPWLGESQMEREREREGGRRAASIFGALVPTSCMYEREVYVFARAAVDSLPPHRGIGNLWRRAGLFIPATLARRLVSSAARDSIIIDYAQLAGGPWTQGGGERRPRLDVAFFRGFCLHARTISMISQ
jgi:hypothetical protein